MKLSDWLPLATVVALPFAWGLAHPATRPAVLGLLLVSAVVAAASRFATALIDPVRPDDTEVSR